VNAFFVGSYAALWVLVLVMAAAILALYNHFGTMYLSSREGRAIQGPAIESRLSPFHATALDGTLVAIPSGRPALLLLASTDCPECGKLLGPLQRIAESRAGELDMVVLCGGRGVDVGAWARGLSAPVRVVADRNFRRATAMGVGITPFVVGVDGGGVVRARGLVNGAEGLGMAAEDVLRAPLDGVDAAPARVAIVGSAAR
jgi:hypothetical protein